MNTVSVILITVNNMCMLFLVETTSSLIHTITFSSFLLGSSLFCSDQLPADIIYLYVFQVLVRTGFRSMKIIKANSSKIYALGLCEYS